MGHNTRGEQPTDGIFRLHRHPINPRGNSAAIDDFVPPEAIPERGEEGELDPLLAVHVGPLELWNKKVRKSFFVHNDDFTYVDP